VIYEKGLMRMMGAGKKKHQSASNISKHGVFSSPMNLHGNKGNHREPILCNEKAATLGSCLECMQSSLPSVFATCMFCCVHCKRAGVAGSNVVPEFLECAALLYL
jgi:hypothetical protein